MSRGKIVVFRMSKTTEWMKATAKASHPHDQQAMGQMVMDANQHIVRGILRAYDASDLTRELWNSQMKNDQTAGDSIGNFAKFCPPTVANGKVYLASFGTDPE